MRSGASSTSGGAGHVELGEHWSDSVLWLCEPFVCGVGSGCGG